MNERVAPVVRVEGLRVSRDDHPVLEDISFEVAPGEFAGICGPNGAGKTTLLKTLLGSLKPDAGEVTVLGALPGRQQDEGIGYVPQRSAVPASFPARVRDVVAMGRMRRRGWRGRLRMASEDREAVRQNLARVGIETLAERPIGQLSGGEQRRVVLAQALCASTRLLILDEPTVGLDLPAEQNFYELCRRLQSELGLSVIAVSHDLVALAGEADRLLCINRRMHVHGNPDEVVHSHALKEAYACEFDFLRGELDHHGRHGPGH
ncbi:MAG: metal ABC transporter ATP-binding protein [bacterium]|nr:metal ABC transporter ATP-binding protein [bacterium]MCP5066187.1 metal ABC transporter ATP-binding protein [bacterium]